MIVKPRMLFVDDRSRRIHAALKKYSNDYDIMIAPNVPEAIRLLSSKDWAVVSLDFDLGGNDLEDPLSKTCAMEIVRYILKTGWPESKYVGKFIVHSSNEFGANLLYKNLVNIFGEDKVTIQRFEYEEVSK